MKVNQKGFTAVEGIIIIAVVAVLGLGGWFVWQSQQEDKPAANSSQGNNDEGTSADGDDQSATKYLGITQWGIKFALTSDTHDAYYDDVTSSSLDSFSLRVHSLDSEPECKTGSQSIATIFRVAKDAYNEDGAPDKMYRDTQDGQVIGDYYYFISGAQYTCAEDLENQVTLQKVRNDFITAGPTIQKL